MLMETPMLILSDVLRLPGEDGDDSVGAMPTFAPVIAMPERAVIWLAAGLAVFELALAEVELALEVVELTLGVVELALEVLELALAVIELALEVVELALGMVDGCTWANVVSQNWFFSSL